MLSALCGGIAGAGCLGAYATLLVPHLFAVAVLPPDELDGDHRVEPGGGDVVVDVEVRMGINVSGTVTITPGPLPAGVTIFYPARFTNVQLDSETEQVFPFTFRAAENAVPGEYSIRFVATGDFGDASDEETTSFTLVVGDCGAPADIAGVWAGTYSCTSSCSDDGLGGEITLTIVQNGSTATYTDSIGGTFAGTVCGNVFTYASTDPAIVETGTFTLTSETQAGKQSHYRATTDLFCEGDCEDTLTRE
ncbi:MAG: hypothetical protein ACKVS9_11400 [Phycisphaerae bacterium]